MGFGALEKLTAAELKKIIKDEGFTCISCHYGLKELKKHAPERIAYAKELGLEQMIVSSFGLPKEATLSDWKKAADDMNKIGEESKKAGIQMGFHNHNNEFEKLEGELIYDALLKQFDPSLVKMQFQVWVISIGYKAADYFKKYQVVSSQHIFTTGLELATSRWPSAKGRWTGKSSLPQLKLVA